MLNFLAPGFRLPSGLILLAALLTLAAPSVRASQADDRYLKIYEALERADALAAKGQKPEAIEKYRAVEKDLRDLRSTFPSYNPKVIEFRLTYLNDRIAKLSEPAAAVDSPSTTATVAATGSNPSETVSLKLLNPGAEPRRVLRFHPNVGDKQSLAISLKITSGVEIPGQGPAQEVKMPTMNFNLETEVKQLLAQGEIVYSATYGEVVMPDEPGVNPAVAQIMKASLGKFSGMTGVGTNSARGLGHGITLQSTAGADPQAKQVIDLMKDSLINISIPLPEEAIGIGAKWETRLPVKSQGMTIDRTVSAELVALNDEQATVKQTLIQRATNQKISNPSMPNMKLDLAKMNGTSQGESTIDLGKLFPVSAKMASHTATSVGDKKQTMIMKLDLDLTVQSK